MQAEAVLAEATNAYRRAFGGDCWPPTHWAAWPTAGIARSSATSTSAWSSLTHCVARTLTPSNGSRKRFKPEARRCTSASQFPGGRRRLSQDKRSGVDSLRSIGSTSFSTGDTSTAKTPAKPAPAELHRPPRGRRRVRARLPRRRRPDARPRRPGRKPHSPRHRRRRRPDPPTRGAVCPGSAPRHQTRPLPRPFPLQRRDGPRRNEPRAADHYLAINQAPGAALVAAALLWRDHPPDPTVARPS